MKNTFALIFTLLFSLAWSTSSDAELADSMLWEVSGQGLESPSYLAGTIHIMCAKDFVILPKLKDAINKTDQLYLELNFKDPKEMASMQELMFTDNLLTETLSDEQQVKLNGVLQKNMNMSLEQVNNYSLNTLFSLLLVSSIECPSKKMLDLELLDLAAAQGKTIGALETFKEQTEFLSQAYPDDFMLEQLELMGEYMHIFDDMVVAYNDQDLNALMAFIEDERFYNETVQRWLLTVRNENWVKKMPAIMQANSTVFAVGAGHLAGEHGVIPLLQQAGYTVKPVMN